MSNQFLNITLIQPNIAWEDKVANLKQYEAYIGSVKEKKEVVVLPEMFSTGFSMNTGQMAETMDGPTVAWLKKMSAEHRCILTGSLIIEDGGKCFNRLLWVQPDGHIGHYDKRHLFGYAEEDKHYSPGDKRLIAQVKGWRICLLVCYDLRFPVWARNQGGEYDVLLYVANWPERRILAWKTLLQTRAIENLSYSVGLNRVGDDGMGIHYSGESSVFGPMGEQLWQHGQTPIVHTITLNKELVTEARNRFPFLNDADRFIIL